MHTLIGCTVSFVVAFVVGALYGHSLQTKIANDFKREMAAAVTELKKLRGEIFRDHSANSGS